MTDITDQDRRVAHEWAASIDPEMSCWSDSARAVARVILATVDAPAPTLAEAVEAWAEKHFSGVVGTGKHELLALASRAEQIEQERDYLAAEIDKANTDILHLTAERDEAREEVDRLRAERDRLEAAQHLSDGSAWGGPVREPTVQKGAESNAENLDPADVKPGEPWLVEVEGERRNAVKDMDDEEPWITINADGRFRTAEDESVTLVARLVPEPRVIANAEDLDALADGSIIRARDGEACRKSDGGDWSVDGLDGAVGYGPRQVLPVTVLWEPGA